MTCVCGHDRVTPHPKPCPAPTYQTILHSTPNPAEDPTATPTRETGTTTTHRERTPDAWTGFETGCFFFLGHGTKQRLVERPPATRPRAVEPSNGSGST